MLSYTPDNTILLFDSYKYSHPRQLRPGTDKVCGHMQPANQLSANRHSYALPALTVAVGEVPSSARISVEVEV